ncbi:MAG: WG repeat-containing protein [Bacteroidales bacterium]|nr:WG repeat-containing protein [Bacteroidales bacterium]
MKKLWQGLKALFSGIVEVLCRLFGMYPDAEQQATSDGETAPKTGNSNYNRVLRRIVGTAFAAIVVLIAVTLLVRLVRFVYRSIDCDNSSSSYLSEVLSDELDYYDDYYEYCKGYVKNSKGRRVLKNIEWIQCSLGDDSIACYSDGERRGYFDVRNGRVVVQPTYDHAWIFSEGLAAVASRNAVQFIDTTGRIAINRKFGYSSIDDGYVFHRGHCAVRDSSSQRMGLIDREGNWVLAPVYESIEVVDTFWLVKEDYRQAVISHGMDTIMPMMEAEYWICDTNIYVTFANHTQSTYSLRGELIASMLIRDVNQMKYNTGELLYSQKRIYEDSDETYYSDYDARKAIATCLRYEAESGWYGLMSTDGRIITPPIYNEIEAIGKDIYLCSTDYGRGIVLDSHGNKVER